MHRAKSYPDNRQEFSGETGTRPNRTSAAHLKTPLSFGCFLAGRFRQGESCVRQGSRKRRHLSPQIPRLSAPQGPQRG